MEDMERRSNCKLIFSTSTICYGISDGFTWTVTQPELERLKKRFMKLDRCILDSWCTLSRCSFVCSALSDGSGSIDREEFLQIPQIATNPLASRMIAIFDEEYASVPVMPWDILTGIFLSAAGEVQLTFRSLLEVWVPSAVEAAGRKSSNVRSCLCQVMRRNWFWT